MLNKNYFTPSSADLDKFKPAVDLYKNVILELIQKSPVITVNAFITWEESVSKEIDDLLTKYAYLSLVYQEEEIMSTYTAMNQYCKEKLSDLGYNKDYYKFIQSLIAEDEQDNILKNKKIKDFEERGLNLPKEKQDELIDISKKLGDLTVSFMQNIAKARKEWSLEISQEIYDSLNFDEKVLFKDLKMEFNLNKIYDMMQTCESEAFREILFNKNKEIASKGSAYDNSQVLTEIASLKHRTAELLGKSSVSELTLKDAMSKDPQTAISFLQNLSDEIYPIAKKEDDELHRFVFEHYGKESIDKFSKAFYVNKMQEHLFNYEKNQERQYLPLDKALEATFSLIKEMFNISFEKVEEGFILPFENAQTYKMYDGDKEKGLVVFDLFERKMKKSGAWVSNYNAPTRDKTGLLALNTNFDINESGLSFDDLTTLLHEFGHLVHAISSETKYRIYSGTMNVPRDAVEIPSQMLEKFAKEPFFLKAVSNDRIPDELVDKVKEIENFRKANFYTRQIGMALYDLDVYSNKDTDAYAAYKINMDKVNTDPVDNDSNFPMVFTHIFSGGYSSGYYGYIWSDVYSVDAFSYIKENRQEMGMQFKKEFLSHGGGIPAKELYLNFRGQDVDLSNFNKFYSLEHMPVVKKMKM